MVINNSLYLEVMNKFFVIIYYAFLLYMSLYIFTFFREANCNKSDTFCKRSDSKRSEKTKKCINNSNNLNSKTLLIGGCGSKFWYFAGILQNRIEKDKKYIDNFDKIVGISGGSLLGCFVICNCDLLVIKKEIIKLTNKLQINKQFTIFKCLDIIKEFYKNNLPEDAYILCSNKLHIQTIHLYSCSTCCFHTFTSNDDLIDKLMKACHIPFLCNTFTNEGYIDRLLNVSKKDCCDNNICEKIILHFSTISNLFDCFKIPDEAFIEREFQKGFTE
jgi:hypothetical protein